MGCSMVMVSKVPLGRLNSQMSDFTIWHKVSQIRVLALVKILKLLSVTLYMYVLFKSFCHDTCPLSVVVLICLNNAAFQDFRKDSPRVY